ncbi:MAG: mandelate racemase [Burkholderiaceae bacterium]|nr:mandelate racemase [Burkholderiaceae bacterium]
MGDRPLRPAMLPIVSARLYEVQTSFSTPYRLSKAYGTLATTRAVFLKLVDADGIEGWGEANPLQPFTAESTEQSLKELEAVLLPAVFAAQNPEPGPIDLLLDRLVPGHLCAKGAISTALLDILGKRLDVPVALLLGGALRQSLPVLWPLGSGTADDDSAVIERRAAQGFRSFMLKMGAAPIEDEILRVQTLKARYGDRIAFIADANQGWSVDEARHFLSAVSGSGLVFVEQPVAKDDIESMAALARESTLALSADESLTGLTEGAEIARRRAAAIFSIKSSKNGGPLRAQKLSSLAQAHGIRCYMNSMLEFGITQAASLHHAVTIDSLVDAGHAFMSTLRLSEDPTDFSDRVSEGTVELARRPGLGVLVDEEHVRRLARSSAELRRPR